MGIGISAIVAGIVGLALAGVTAFGVVSSNTAAPSKNPAGVSAVQYGNR